MTIRKKITKYGKIKDLKAILNSDINYLSGCFSSIHFMFTYINVSAKRIKNLKSYHKDVGLCLELINDNKILYTGFNIILYYFCEVVTKHRENIFEFLDDTFNIEFFKDYIRFKLVEIYSKKFGYDSEDMIKFCNEMLCSSHILYEYLYKEIFINYDIKTFLVVGYGMIIIFLAVAAENRQEQILEAIIEIVNRGK